MKSIKKALIILAAALCVVLTCGLLFACGEEQTTYTVKVVLPDDDQTPVEGVEITFFDEEDETLTYATVTTNADGLARATLDTADYRVKITDGMPEGYTLFNADDDEYCTRTWGKSSNKIITLDEATRTYTVTVYHPGGTTGAAGVEVTFTPQLASEESVTVTTDNKGKATATLPADIVYSVTIDQLPSNSVVSAGDENMTTSRGTSLVFALVNPVTYSFEVNGPQDAIIEGIEVSYSATPTGVRYPLGVTDADGKLTIKRSPITGYAFIKSPEGFVYNEFYNYTDEANTPYLLKEKSTSVSFELYPVAELTYEKQLDTNEIATFNAATKSQYDKTGLFADTMEQPGRIAYSNKATVSANQTYVFSFRAQEEGVYNFFVNFSGSGSIYCYQSLDLHNPYVQLTSKAMNMRIDCEKGSIYYFSVNMETPQDIQIVFASPAEKNEYIVSDTGEYELTIKESLPAMLYFDPPQSGTYEISVLNGESGYLIETINSVTLNVMAGASSTNGKVSADVYNSVLYDAAGVRSAAMWIYRFSSKAETPAYPITITVKIVRTGDVIEKTTRTEYVQVQETLHEFTAENGVLTQLGVVGMNARVQKYDDGYYHLDSATGPIVYVKLKGTIPVFYPDMSFDQLDGSSAFYSLRYEETDTEIVYYNYAEMLRGYKTYLDVDGPYADEYYLKYVNADGVYPLNDELADFLKLVAKNQAPSFALYAGVDKNSPDLWLFSAFYYDPNGTEAPDEDTTFVGSGTQADPYLLSFESGATSLRKGVTIVEADEGSEEEIKMLYCSFTAEEGNYVITLLNSYAEIGGADGWLSLDIVDGYPSYSFHLNDGESFDFYLSAFSASIPLSYAFTIELVTTVTE